MRFVVDVEQGPTGRVTGTVTPPGRDPVGFEGWLDLVRLLEDRTEVNVTPGKEPS